MDKLRLHKIFSQTFNHSEWIEVLKDVFGANQLLVQPRPIMLPSNDKAKAAYELGNFTTSDDRIIGLYKIELNEDVWLERNKVGLRALLRKVYDYDVDGAIIVFEQNKKWRLSFVSEIKVLNDEGEVIKQATEPKRFTYLLGEDEKVRTPSDRLSKLVGKTLALKDILEAFSVEALNEEFYKIIAHYFYQLIGGKIGKGKKATDFGDGILQLPSVPKIKTNRLVYQEFAVRLIGRTIFSWFLKMKKSDAGKELLPESLLSSKAVKDNSGYYHTILERLFFQTLNTKMENRVNNLPKGCEQIPFLNGGLFEPDADDYYRPNNITGISENLNTLKISDDWFFKFFTELEKYNFTIDENSVTDVEVSVDPEMLGRIFENLLAEIDPDSGETARKATGSFYTPREIVDYMATESLVQYLHNKTELKHEQLRPIFKMTHEFPDFTEEEKETILNALDKIKILDPACGSGAFPMGVLQKIVMALQKLDPDAIWWTERQVKRIKNQYVRKALREKLEDSSVEYARKIGVIQNSLYGVDIQPIAAEISKLRCFLSLVVDETINENKPNRGIEPLPNLEFKFVTADTLQKLPEQKKQRTMFDNFEELQKLEELRINYLQSSGKKKEKIKEQYIKVQTKMFKNELHLFTDTQSRAYKLSSWNPFSHEKADWFDPKWMYGVENFDVVIGNPPYVSFYSNTGSTLTTEQKIYYLNNFDSVIKENDRINSMNLFTERGIGLLSNNGNLSYIVNKTMAVLPSYKSTRKTILSKSKINYIVSGLDPFKAVVDCVVIGCSKDDTENLDNYNLKYYNGQLNEYTEVNSKEFTNNLNLEYHVSKFSTILNKIQSTELSLGEVLTINRGVNIGGHFDEFLNNEKVNSNYHKFIAKIKSLNPYSYNWDEKIDSYFIFDTELENELRSNGSTMVLGNPDRYLQPKLFIPESARHIQASYVAEQIYSAYGIMVGTKLNKDYQLKFLTAILNSSIISFYAIEKEILRKGSKATPHVGVKGLKSLPIKKTAPYVQEVFCTLVDYILRVKDSFIEINPHVPNTHISKLFEEVIDAMVMELYFEEDFKKAGIEFIKYAERDFKAIEHLKTEEEKIEVIHEAYQKLRQKDNEIRNNLKLMDIKLADIVMPIKTVR